MKRSFRLFYILIAIKFAKSHLIGYISGGLKTAIKKYPHSVYLVINCGYSYVCGGSILNQVVILTAAHCTDDCKKISVQIRYGHEHISYMKSTYMKEYIRHQGYHSPDMVNDICLMSTAKPIPLSAVAKRVILMRNPPTVKYAYVAGWGLDEHKRPQKILKGTSATIQKIKVCLKMGKVPKGTFCAGPVTGIGAADVGDSGSALVIDGYIQIGFVSFKVEKYSLVSYTNVSYHLEWIKKHSKVLICK